MRQVASVQSDGPYKRLMLYEADRGAYLFLYVSSSDGPCDADCFFQTVADALQSAQDDFGVTDEHWTEIPDPQPGCQHDWVLPTRIRRDAEGNRLHGQSTAQINE